MTDNSKYTKGYDFYQGNTITDWKKLDAAFIYNRAAIGLYTDAQFLNYSTAGAAAGFAVGGFLELWPGIGATAHHRTIDAAHALELTTLPFALAFEKEPVKDIHRGYVWTWPSFGDAISLYQALDAEAGRSPGAPGPMMYTNLDGLNQAREQGFAKILPGLRWWISRYFDHPGLMGEMGVDDTLSLLEGSYGIPAAQVLFMQTSKGGIPYPPGFSPDLDADIDRAVSWAFQPAPLPPPPPEPNPAGQLVLFHDDAEQEKVSYFHPDPIATIIDLATRLQYNPPAIVTPPAPPPVVPPVTPPAPALNLYRVKWMKDCPENLKASNRPADPYNKPDVHSGAVDSVVPLTSELQWFWFGLIRAQAPASFTDEDLKRVWRNMTASNRAFTNDKGSDVSADYISGKNLTAGDPITMPKFYKCGGGVVNVLKDGKGNNLTKMVQGELCYGVQALDPRSHPTTDTVNHEATPYLVDYATIDYGPALVGAFGQLDGNNVPVPNFGEGGVNYLPARILEKIPEGSKIPSPYLPAR